MVAKAAQSLRHSGVSGIGGGGLRQAGVSTAPGVFG